MLVSCLTLVNLCWAVHIPGTGCTIEPPPGWRIAPGAKGSKLNFVGPQGLAKISINVVPFPEDQSRALVLETILEQVTQSVQRDAANGWQCPPDQTVVSHGIPVTIRRFCPTKNPAMGDLIMTFSPTSERLFVLNIAVAAHLRDHYEPVALACAKSIQDPQMTEGSPVDQQIQTQAAEVRPDRSPLGQDPHDPAEGVQVLTRKDGSRTETFFNEDGARTWMRVYGDQDYLLYEENYTQFDGETVFHGTCMRWFPAHSKKRGQIQFRCTYRQGVAQGPYIERRDTGYVAGNLEEGLLDGRWAYFDVNDSLRTVRTFRAGLSDGLQQTYYPDGTLKTEILVVGHVPVSYKRFYDSGEPEVMCQGTFARTIMAGEQPAGARARHSRDLCSVGYDTKDHQGLFQASYAPVIGLVKHWRLDASTGESVLGMEFQVKGGKFHGPRILYHDNGRPRVVENCKEGQLHGVCTIYYEDGTVQHTANMLEGRPTGRYQFRQAPGQRLIEVAVVQGHIVGWLPTYDRDDRLTTLSHHIAPDMATGPVYQCGKIDIQNGWPRVSSYARAGRVHGPVIEFGPEGQIRRTVYKTSGGTTYHAETYLRWCREHDDLPREIPGLGPIGSRTKDNRMFAVEPVVSFETHP